MYFRVLFLFSVLSFSFVACNTADRLGVGAACKTNDDCKQDNQQCLTPFKGGYCGSQGCKENKDCPSGAACVTHTDSKNYCFRVCNDKAECNANRSADSESNCSANVTFASGQKEGKACVPPSAG